MATFPLSARKYFFRTPPRSSALAMPGSVAVVAVSGSATYIDLVALDQQSGAQNSPLTSSQDGCLDQYVTVFAVTATVGIVTGNTVAIVTGANAPSLTGAGTLTSGAYTPSGTECLPIPPGTSFSFIPQGGLGPITTGTQGTGPIDRYLGIIGSGAGYCGVFISSAMGA